MVNFDEIDRIININYNLPMAPESLRRKENKNQKAETLRPIELPREFRANTYERVGRMSIETIEDILHGNRKAIPITNLEVAPSGKGMPTIKRGSLSPLELTTKKISMKTSAMGFGGRASAMRRKQESALTQDETFKGALFKPGEWGHKVQVEAKFPPC